MREKRARSSRPPSTRPEARPHILEDKGQEQHHHLKDDEALACTPEQSSPTSPAMPEKSTTGAKKK
jgi:hypothetical protein